MLCIYITDRHIYRDPILHSLHGLDLAAQINLIPQYYSNRDSLLKLTDNPFKVREGYNIKLRLNF